MHAFPRKTYAFVLKWKNYHHHYLGPVRWGGWKGHCQKNPSKVFHFKQEREVFTIPSSKSKYEYVCGIQKLI